MIWVIGDIHGMIYPLERILEAIRQYDQDEEKVDKVIFLGDYIDHGHYSREVLDAIIELEFPVVYLMGNHEDMAIRYLRRLSRKFFHYDAWLEEGADPTFRALLSHKNLKKFIAAENKYCSGRGPKLGKGILPQEKYLKFILSLVYSHEETFFSGNSQIRFRFFHGLPRLDLPLDDQMVGKFDDFEKFLDTPRSHTIGCGHPKKYLIVENNGEDASGPDISSGPIEILDYTALWGRNYSYYYAYTGDGVIVHGHSPTVCYHEYCKRESKVPKDFIPMYHRYKLESQLPFLFTRVKSGGYVDCKPTIVNGDIVKFDPGENGYVEAINIDTGAVYKGGALTALGLSERLLAKGQLLVLTTITIPSDHPERSFYGNILDKPEREFPAKSPVFRRVIDAGRLSPQGLNKELNPVFPMERALAISREDELKMKKLYAKNN